MATLPSGEQIELALGEQQAVVVEVGGGLRAYSVAGSQILDGYGPSEQCSGGRGHPLMPWPNRVRDGKYEWEGESHQLDITEPALGNALHGLTRWCNWRAREREPARVVMELRLYPHPGYPFTLDLELTYELTESGLAVAAQAMNVGARACPYGVGFHPYFRLAGAEQIDSGLLTLPTAARQIADERLIPHSQEALAGTAYDFLHPRVLGDLALDTCFTDVRRDPDGLARVVFASAEEAGETVIWFDDAYSFLMVFTGETLAPSERRRGIAIEPMSCAPNAFQSGEGLVRLEPGETHVARWGIAAA
jgi:aldose 1-epimerase